MLGGTGSFGFGGGNGGFTGNIGLQPRAGIFLTDRLVAGAGIGLGLSTYRTFNEGRTTIYATSIQPFARYYFGKAPGSGEVPKGIVPFVEAGGGVSGVRVPGEWYTGASAYGAVGFNKFFNEHVAFEVNLSYTRQSNSFVGSPYQPTRLGGGIGFQIFLGRGSKKAAPAGPGTSDR